MPVEMTLKLYTFEELTPEVQNKLINEYIQDLPGWWSDDVEERIKNEAEALGIQDFDFSWSGFWSQGDGLSFTGRLSFETWLDILRKEAPEWGNSQNRESEDTEGYKSLNMTLDDVVSLHKKQIITWGECKVFRHMHQYCHENTVNITTPEVVINSNKKVTWDWVGQFRTGVQKYLKTWKNELCNRWYADLQESYEAHTDRDNIIENICGQELLFTISGIVVDNGELV